MKVSFSQVDQLPADKIAGRIYFDKETKSIYAVDKNGNIAPYSGAAIIKIGDKEYEVEDGTITLPETDLSSLEDLINDKVNKEDGKVLSSNDFTTSYKEKLDALDTALSGKQDVIKDLDTIRKNAANALKSIPDEYITEGELSANYYNKGEIDTSLLLKQDKINDLDDIRNKISNALQSETDPVFSASPASSITEENLESLNNFIYLTITENEDNTFECSAEVEEVLKNIYMGTEKRTVYINNKLVLQSWFFSATWQYVDVFDYFTDYESSFAICIKRYWFLHFGDINKTGTFEGLYYNINKAALSGSYKDLTDKPTIPQHNTYETEALYQDAVTAGEVDPKDLSFVKETGKLYTQGGVYGGGGVEARLVYTKQEGGQSLTEDQIAYNVETYNKLIAAGNKIVTFAYIGPDIPLMPVTFVAEFFGILLFSAFAHIFENSIEVTTVMLVSDGDSNITNKSLLLNNSVEAAIIEFNLDGSALTAEQKAHNREIFQKISVEKAVQVYANGIALAPLQQLSISDTEIISYSTLFSPSGSLVYDLLKLTSDGDLQTIESKEYPLGITIDTELSDISENAVQNKVVKKYIDEAVANAGGGSGDGSQFALRELKLGDGEGNYTEEELAYNQETRALLMAGKYVRFNGNGLTGLSQITSEDGYVVFTNSIEVSIMPGAPILVTSIIFNEDGTIDAMELMVGGLIGGDFSEAYISNLIAEYDLYPIPTQIYTEHQVRGPYWVDGSILTQSTYIRSDFVTEEEYYFCYGFKNGPVTFELMINTSSGEYKYAITEGVIFVTTDSHLKTFNLEIRNYKQILASKFTVLYDSHTCSILFTIGQYGFAFLDPSTGDILRYEIQEDGSVTEITQ